MDARFKPKHDWPTVRKAWLQWQQQGRKPEPTLQQFAMAHDVPYHSLAKHTAKWKRDIQSKQREQTQHVEVIHDGNLTVTGLKSRTGGVKAGKANAYNTHYTSKDKLRLATENIKNSVVLATEALKAEVINGTSAARIAAAKELLDRAGLLKATESKTEMTPYEEMERTDLVLRMNELFGVWMPKTHEAQTGNVE